ncbi:MAG: creatininase family protein [Rickettsiales bacterium]|nr:creatininase family protein [Rickettsiales bacterium]
MKTVFAFLLGLSFLAPLASYAAEVDSVYMEELTWMEIRDRMQAGANIAIIPTGGHEQNGPHMVEGKHNIIVRYTAGEIARKLNNALVAPVINYVPEGRINPPEGHMNFAGTISIRDETFAMLLEDAAASLKQHGFKLICFVGDSSGNQEIQRQVAAKLSSKWNSSGVRVLHVSNYYYENGQEQWVGSIGLKVQNPTAHAGFMDTSELMALGPQGVRPKLLGDRGIKDYDKTGSLGDSTLASAAHGKKLLSLKIQAAYEQIRYASSHPE